MCVCVCVCVCICVCVCGYTCVLNPYNDLRTQTIHLRRGLIFSYI